MMTFNVFPRHLRRCALPLAVLLLAACSSSEPDTGATASAGEADPAVALQAIRIDEQHRADSGIELAEAKPGAIALRVRLYGSLEIPPDRRVELTPRYAGVVRSVSASLGQTLAAGQTLAQIESSDSLVAYRLSSPLAGRVLMRDAQAGMAVTPDHVLFVIGDTSTLWVRLAVSPVDAAVIRPGQPLELADSNGAVLAQTTVLQLLPMGDPERPLLRAYAEVPNAQGALLPGQFVHADITTESRQVPVTVPSTAIQSLDNGPVVFVETPQGFVPQPVRPGLDDGELTEILDGLQAGQQVVAARSYLLKSEWLTQGEGE